MVFTPGATPGAARPNVALLSRVGRRCLPTRPVWDTGRVASDARRSIRQALDRYRRLGKLEFLRYVVFRALGVVQMSVHQRRTDREALAGYAIDELRAGDVDVFRRRGVREELIRELDDAAIALVHRNETGEADAFFVLAATPFDFRGHDWLVIVPSSGDICGRYLWVAPEVRGRGIDPALNVAADARCRAAGFDHIVSMVSAFNAPSLRADEKIGYSVVLRLTVWRMLGVCFAKFGRHLVVGRFDGLRPASFSFDTVREFGS